MTLSVSSDPFGFDIELTMISLAGFTEDRLSREVAANKA